MSATDLSAERASAGAALRDEIRRAICYARMHDALKGQPEAQTALSVLFDAAYSEGLASVQRDPLPAEPELTLSRWQARRRAGLAAALACASARL